MQALNYFKISHARSLFLYIRLFNTVDSKFSIYFSADDWIQTMDLWNRKRLLYLLMHNHCPSFDFFVSDMIVFVLINSKFKIKAKSSPWAANVSGCSKRTRHGEKEN